MIGRRSFPFLVGLTAIDTVAVLAALFAAYRLRFAGFPIAADKGIPEVVEYLRAAPTVVLLALLSNRLAGLYRPSELSSLLAESWAVLRSSVWTGVLVAAAAFFYRGYEYSRMTLILFVVVNVPFLTGMRISARLLLRRLDLRRMITRRCLIVGTGRQAQQALDRMRDSPYPLYEPVAFLDPAPDAPARAELRNLPVHRADESLSEVIAQHRVELIIAAVSHRRYEELQALLERLTRETPDVVLVPDDFGLFVLRARAFDYRGLPMIALLETPLSGPDRFFKRALDIAGSAALLIVASPLLLLLSLLVKLSSRGPVLYRQERMGLDGRVFTIFKFRTMRVDAEAESGPQWATPDDQRRTRLGTLLRRTSLDELPQLLNVLVGAMSLVGPRPERPAFISEFRDTIPNYMLRHRIKAGMTGWAQVHGWRGDTSLRKRLQYDLYYIRNWSIGLDVRILVLTIFRGIINKNAY